MVLNRGDNDVYRFESHPLYGRIRIVCRMIPDRLGGVHESWEYDPEFEPALPAGALRGDPAQQHFCSVHHVPKYFYVDERRVCVQCATTFTFHAGEQRFWYEALKFNFSSVAIRCRKCRRQRRTVKALHSQVAAARTAVDGDPENPINHLALAEALVRLSHRIGRGNLDDAISAARRARELWPRAAESWFWEGAAHHLAGRSQRAEETLSRFLKAPKGNRGHVRKLEAEARDMLGGG